MLQSVEKRVGKAVFSKFFTIIFAWGNNYLRLSCLYIKIFIKKIKKNTGKKNRILFACNLNIK